MFDVLSLYSIHSNFIERVVKDSKSSSDMYRALDEDDVEDEDETTLEAEPLRESVEGGEFKSDSRLLISDESSSCKI